MRRLPPPPPQPGPPPLAAAWPRWGAAWARASLARGKLCSTGVLCCVRRSLRTGLCAMFHPPSFIWPLCAATHRCRGVEVAAAAAAARRSAQAQGGALAVEAACWACGQPQLDKGTIIVFTCQSISCCPVDCLHDFPAPALPSTSAGTSHEPCCARARGGCTRQAMCSHGLIYSRGLRSGWRDTEPLQGSAAGLAGSSCHQAQHQCLCTPPTRNMQEESRRQAEAAARQAEAAARRTAPPAGEVRKGLAGW